MRPPDACGTDSALGLVAGKEAARSGRVAAVAGIHRARRRIVCEGVPKRSSGVETGSFRKGGVEVGTSPRDECVARRRDARVANSSPQSTLEADSSVAQVSKRLELSVIAASTSGGTLGGRTSRALGAAGTFLSANHGIGYTAVGSTETQRAARLISNRSNLQACSINRLAAVHAHVSRARETVGLARRNVHESLFAGEGIGRSPVTDL